MKKRRKVKRIKLALEEKIYTISHIFFKMIYAMQSTINKILEEIDLKKQELKTEYEKMRKKYNFEYIKGKIQFAPEQKIQNKKWKKPFISGVFNARIRELLSIPFIYSMIIPAIILDIFIFMYQNTAIRLYGIPLAKRRDYIKFDRKSLDYLNWLEKLNCLYCSYFNGLLGYAREVAARTERYWCPIKYANNRLGEHEWEKFFADFGDAEGFRELYTNNSDFQKKIDSMKQGK